MAEVALLANISVNLQKLLKNKIAVISVLAFVVALSCVFAFAGNTSEPELQSETLNESIADNNQSETEIFAGYGIYVDGYFVAATHTSEQADKAVAASLANRVSSFGIDTSLNNSFNNSVEIIFGDYSSDAYVENVAVLMGESVFDYSGTQLPVNLSVTSVSTYSENVVLEYETKTVYTDSMKDGTSKVVQEGFSGEGIQTYEIVSLNGVEIERNPLCLEVTTEVVNEVVRVGIGSDGKTTASLANFVRPYNPEDGLVISSYFGYRWGTNHNGLDICRNGGCFKDPVVAASAGVVISAKDSNNGYGNCVIIDHGDGITTWYAHLNQCLVEPGDIVEAGEEIGLIGSTGYSYGPHLHFEVRIDNVPVNPLMFVDYE